MTQGEPPEFRPKVGQPQFNLDDEVGFQASIAALAQAGDYKGCDRAVRLRLYQVTASDSDLIGGRPKREVELGLWRSLRALYVERLFDKERAIAASEMLIRLRPGDAEERRVLAGLVADADVTRAVALLEQSLVLEPHSIPSLRLLLDMHRRAEAWFEVHAVCAVLDFHRALSETERAHFWNVKRVALGPSTFRLTAKESKLLEPRDAAGALDRLLFLVAPTVIRHLPDPGDRSPLPHEPMFGQVLRWAADMLGAEVPRVGERLSPGASRPPRDARLDARVGNHTLGELAFIAGRHLASLRPWEDDREEGITRASFSRRTQGHMKFILFGMCVLTGSGHVPPDVLDAATTLAGWMREELSPYAKTEIARILDECRGPFQVSHWARSDAMTCARTGLVLAGDFATANRVLQADSTLAGHDRVALLDDLCSFSASSTFVRLGRALQLGVAQHYPLPSPPSV